MKNSCKKSCNTCLGEDAPNDPDILFQRGGDIGGKLLHSPRLLLEIEFVGEVTNVFFTQVFSSFS